MLVLRQTEALNAEVDAILSVGFPSVQLAGDIWRHAGQVRRLQFQSVLAADSAALASYQQGIESAIAQTNQAIDSYTRLSVPHNRLLFLRTAELWHRYEAYNAPFMKLMWQGQRASAIELINLTARFTYFDFVDSCDALVQSNEILARQGAERVRSGQQFTRRTVVAVLIAIILCTVLVAYVIVRSISKPAQELQRAAQAITAGNYDVAISTSGASELGALADSFRVMQSAIARTITEQRHLNLLHTVLTGDKTLSLLAHDVLSHLAQTFAVSASALYLPASVQSSSVQGTVAQVLSEALPLERSSVEDAPTLVLIAAYAMRDAMSPARLIIGEGLVRQAAQDRKPIHMEHLSPELTRLRALTPLHSDVFPSCLRVVPLLYQQTLVGVLELWTLQSWTDERVRLLDAMLEPIAVALYTAHSKALLYAALHRNVSSASNVSNKFNESNELSER